MTDTSFNLAATYTTVLTGTLYKTVTSDIFATMTMNLNYRLISIVTSYLVAPAAIQASTYVVTDPVQSLDIGTFGVVDTGGLTPEFELRSASVGNVDATIFNLASLTNNPPTMLIYSNDNSKIGSYDFVIRARFMGTNIPYYVDSAKFTVIVLH